LTEAELLKLFAGRNYIPIVVGSPENMVYKYHKKFLKFLGFKIRGQVDVFFKCKFPDGWYKKVMDDTNNWCYLYDDKHRKRGALFYKYIKKNEDKTVHRDTVTSHINYMPRYRVKIDHKIPFDIKTKNSAEYKESPLIGYVVDSEDTILFQTKEIKVPKQKEDDYKDNIKIVSDSLFKECSKWLDVNYPNSSRLDLYWD